ncbi:phosphoserine phosphatase SerB [Streptococcus hongkongensis]|nr:phosphoserine phosphatase [Streptococcus uberis]
MEKVEGLFVMDVDSTLVKEEVIDLLAEEAGYGEEVAQLTDLAMNGQLNFEEALRKRVSLLENLPVTIFDKVSKKIHFNKGAKELIDALHARHFKVGLVSGGFHETVDILAEELGIDYVKANHLGKENGKLTGLLEGDIVTKEVKLQQLRKWASENNLEIAQTIAMGDGANDIPMIEAAGIGIAFCAKEIVKTATPYHINKGDLMEAITFLEEREK